MYRLIKIWELDEELTGGPGKLLAVDVPDAGSPTGYTTKFIQAENLKQVQNLEEVLTVGRQTGLNEILINEGSALAFERGPWQARIQPQASQPSDILLQLPTEAGELELKYDSGWKTIPIWNGSYGLPNTGNVAYRPKIRIVNRTVYIKGLFLIAMPTAPGGTTLDTNGALYVTKFYSDVYTGPGGYAVNPTGREALRTPVLLPSALWPEESTRLYVSNGGALYRTVNIAGRVRLTAWTGALTMTNQGWLGVATNNTVDRNGDTGTGWDKTSHARMLTDRFQAGDSILAYDNYYTSFDGAFATDKRTVNDHGSNWSWTHDGNTASDLGGFSMFPNGTWQLSPSLTLDQIKTAFDAL